MNESTPAKRPPLYKPYVEASQVRMDDLERAGWEFDTRKDGDDYVNIVVAKPRPRQLSFVLVPEWCQIGKDSDVSD